MDVTSQFLNTRNPSLALGVSGPRSLMKCSQAAIDWGCGLICRLDWGMRGIALKLTHVHPFYSTIIEHHRLGNLQKIF